MIQCGQGDTLPSVRFIRFAKLTVLIADLWTLAYVALVFGWQTFIFHGSWQALPLSFVFGTQSYSDGDVDSTASIDKIDQSQATTFANPLLQLPILTLLLLAAAFLSAFYLWLHNTEKRLTNT
jgi:hypothetical protein